MPLLANLKIKISKSGENMQKLHVISQDEARFKDRVEAGQLLGQALARFRGQASVVLGIPRGGVIIAKVVAQILNTEFDIVLSRKMGAPGNPEVAIGAVSENGRLFVNHWATSYGRVTADYIQREKIKQQAEIARRQIIYRQARPKISLQNKIVIIVDDGVATGATMEAALWAMKEESPSRIIAALPVAPRDALERLVKIADEVICLRAPHLFMAVGEFYEVFEQVTHEEVINILKGERREGEA